MNLFISSHLFALWNAPQVIAMPFYLLHVYASFFPSIFMYFHSFSFFRLIFAQLFVLLIHLLSSLIALFIKMMLFTQVKVTLSLIHLLVHNLIAFVCYCLFHLFYCQAQKHKLNLKEKEKKSFSFRFACSLPWCYTFFAVVFTYNKYKRNMQIYTRDLV